MCLNVSSDIVTRFTKSSSMVTSHFAAMALPPSKFISSATCCADSKLKSETTTFAPKEANIFELARPMPFPPPVMIAVLPDRLNNDEVFIDLIIIVLLKKT